MVLSLNTAYRVYKIAVLVELKRRHCTDATVLSRLFVLININLSVASETPIKTPASQTFAKTTCGYFSESSWKNGEMILQGPHHVAKKSITTNFDPAFFKQSSNSFLQGHSKRVRERGVVHYKSSTTEQLNK
eukprot:757799-Hanusia_phi.AAC.3